MCTPKMNNSSACCLKKVQSNLQQNIIMYYYIHRYGRRILTVIIQYNIIQHGAEREIEHPMFVPAGDGKCIIYEYIDVSVCVCVRVIILLNTRQTRRYGKTMAMGRLWCGEGSLKKQQPCYQIVICLYPVARYVFPEKIWCQLT